MRPRSLGLRRFAATLLACCAVAATATNATTSFGNNASAPYAQRAQIATMAGYPKPSCHCRTILDGSVEDVLDALLDADTHSSWVSRLEESVVITPPDAAATADGGSGERIVYYRFALPFPAWDRQVSAALFCDRFDDGGAIVELRRVGLPPPKAAEDDAAAPPEGAREPALEGARDLPLEGARDPPLEGAREPTWAVAPPPRRRPLGGARGATLRAALDYAAGPRIASARGAAAKGLDRLLAAAPPRLAARLRRRWRRRGASDGVAAAAAAAAAEERAECVTLPAFRVSYHLAPESPRRTRIELKLGADPGVWCPDSLLRWGLGHADRTLENLQAIVHERTAARALQAPPVPAPPAPARIRTHHLFAKGARKLPWPGGFPRLRPPRLGLAKAAPFHVPAAALR